MRDEITPAARVILARVFASAQVELLRSGDGVTSLRPAVRPVVVRPAAGSFSGGRAMSLHGAETCAGVTGSNCLHYPLTALVGEQSAAGIRRSESPGYRAASFSRS
jgi:hypothetical protein